MTTFTLNRNMSGADCLFVALNDASYADWREAELRSTYDQPVYVTGKSVRERILEFFRR